MTDDGQPQQKDREAKQHLRVAAEHHKGGRFEAARASCRAALRANRNDPDALHLLGVVTHMLGDTQKAIGYVGQSLALRPDFPPALSNLSRFYASAGMYAEAVEKAERALEITPEFEDALASLASAQRSLGKVEAALGTYRTLERLRPGDTRVLRNIGVCLMDLSRLDEACETYRKAAGLAPDNNDLRYHLAVTLNTASRFDEALPLMEETLQRNPDDVPALITAGESLQSLGRMEEALEFFERAVSLAPDHAEAHFNLGLTLMTLGDYVRGWDEYAWRIRTGAYKDYRPPLSAPLWQGEPLEGKSLLVYPEQGMGDTINFIRYAALARDRGARVLCLSPGSLLRLLKTCEALDQVLAPGEELDVPDFQISIMELPRVLDAGAGPIPLSDGYLKAPDMEFEPAGAVSAGIVWQGNPVLKNDANRSVPLAMFGPLAGVDGVQLYSLQVGPGTEQIEAIDWRDDLIPLGDGFQDYADTAAVIAKLDLVIAVDTSVAHLAGALGKPVWLLLPANADWRWGREGERTPWYSSMRMFRQPALGRWDSVFAILEDEIRELVASKAVESR
ncbi:MAG: tetratricopeptide repeat protein [Rhodospirillales bacterium]